MWMTKSGSLESAQLGRWRHAAQLIAEEMTFTRTPACPSSRRFGSPGLSVSRDECFAPQRSDRSLAVYPRKTVEAMGGSLSLIAEFPDRKPIQFCLALAETSLRQRVRFEIARACVGSGWRD